MPRNIWSGAISFGLVTSLNQREDFLAAAVGNTERIVALVSVDGELAAFEVAEEVLPLGIGGGAVFLCRPQGAAAGDEVAMGFDGLFWVDRVVGHRGVDVGVAGDDLRDVRREARTDGIGDEQAAEVVRREDQRLTG